MANMNLLNILELQILRVKHKYENLKKIKKNIFSIGMWDRTINILSAGKLFCATGIRIGWTISCDKISKCIKAFH